jgi:phosphate-selective porin OprO/OprP
MIDQMVPQRDVGAMIHGQKLFDNRLDYAVSISNGEINGNGDDNQSKDVVGRIVVRPFANWDATPWLQYFQAGMAATYGIEQEPASPSTLKTPSQVPWFMFFPTVHSDGERYRLCPEVSYFCGGFGVMAEYYFEMHRYSPLGQGSPIDRDVGFEGFQVTATYLLTGERRTTYSAPIDPLHPIDPLAPLSGTGAWELLARVSRLKVDSAAFQPGPGQLADPARSSSGATEMTLGFNWYLNNYVRWQFNWEHDWFDQQVQQATVPPSRYQHQDALLVRLQLIF